MAPIHAAVPRWWAAVANASDKRSSMRAAAWLVDTVATSSSRLSGIMAGMVLRRAQTHNSMASSAALKPA